MRISVAGAITLAMIASENPTAPTSNSHRLTPLLAFGLLILLIGTAGTLVFEQNKKSIAEEELQNLGAIADLKVQQITFWHDSQKKLAESFLRNAVLPAIVEEWRRDGMPSNGRKRQLLKVLASLKQTYNYKSVWLFDSQGITRLTTDENDPPDEADRKLAMEAMRKRQVLFSDLHKNGPTKIEMDFAAPLAVENGKNGRVVGALLFRIDPNSFLFPLIQTWPTPSPTAETTLSRREGNDVLFLNNLRHIKGTALSLRLPLSDKRLPAAMAVLGQRKAVEGIDYRGVPVIAVLRGVPGTPWSMVSKIDTQEILAPIDTLEKWVAGIALILIAGGGGLILLWHNNQQRRYRYLEAQYDAAIEREALLNRYETLTRCANDAIMVADFTGKIIEANDRAVENYGYSREELLQMRIRDFRLPTEEPAILAEQLHQLRKLGGLRFEATNRRKDGTIFPLEASLRLIDMKGEKYILGILRDISQRKEAEHRILRLNALYAAVSQVNEAIVRIKDSDALLQEICRIAVDNGQFCLAWIGLIDTGTGDVNIIASSGPAKGYTDTLHISTIATESSGQGPTGKAIREGRIHVCNDFFADPQTLPWQENARQHGIRATVSCPLKHEGQVIGALAVYAAEADYFDQELVGLLSRIADSLSIALDNFAHENRRKQAEQDLWQQRRFVRQVIDTDPNRIFVKDSDGRFLLANTAIAKAHGMTPQEMVGRKNAAVNTNQEEVERYLKVDREVIESRQKITYFETSTLGGETRWFLTTKIPMEQPDGAVHVLGISVDITERKLAEDKLAASYKQLRMMAEYLETVREEEQKRIARELHDEMGGTLAALSMKVARLAAKPPADTAHLLTEADAMAKLVTAAIQTMRHTVAKLRPSILDDGGLIPAMEHHIQEFQQHSGITCKLINHLTEAELLDHELEELLDRDRATAVFRILQESLTNVVKHAQASKITISLKELNGSLVMTIKDNGKGFDQSIRSEAAFGLRGIRERAFMAGGKIKISSVIGKGTTVWVGMPMNPPDSSSQVQASA